MVTADLNRVRAFAGVLDDHVLALIDDVVDEVDVIALPADERIVAAAAIECVVAVIAGDLVLLRLLPVASILAVPVIVRFSISIVLSC